MDLKSQPSGILAQEGEVQVQSTDGLDSADKPIGSADGEAVEVASG